MELKEFTDLVQKTRTKDFLKPSEFAEQIFNEQYSDYDQEYFRNNFSNIIEKLRDVLYISHQHQLDLFQGKMTKILLESAYGVKKSYSDTELSEFFVDYNQYLYEMNKSTTNSWRSRAGKEFEAMIETTLKHAGVPYESQKGIGKEKFSGTEFSKLVDIVIPSVEQFQKDKFNCVIISAKTTLRERWQETVEEINRTGIRTMYLITLDEKVSANNIKRMNESNIRIVTTEQVKKNYYLEESNVISLEEMIKDIQKYI